MALMVEVVRSFAAPGLREAWTSLSSAAPGASVFSSYDWCRCWHEHIEPTAPPAILLFRDTDGHVVGLLPTCVHRAQGARWLSFLGRRGVGGDHFDLLCVERARTTCLASLEQYLEHGDVDGVLLGELHADSALRAALETWARRRGLAVQEREQRVLPFALLPTRFDEFLAARSANMRYHVRRRRREMQRLPGAALRLRRSEDEVQASLEELFRLHAARWAVRRAPGVLGSPQKQEFLRAYCRAAGRRDEVRLYELCIETRIHAVLLAMHCSGVAYFYQMGWDPQCPLHSPGVLVMAASIEQAIAEGMSRYDFLRGDEEYKARWTGEYVQASTIAIALRAPARAALAAERLKNGVKRLVLGAGGARTWRSLKALVGADA